MPAKTPRTGNASKAKPVNFANTSTPKAKSRTKGTGGKNGSGRSTTPADFKIED